MTDELEQLREIVAQGSGHRPPTCENLGTKLRNTGERLTRIVGDEATVEGVAQAIAGTSGAEWEWEAMPNDDDALDKLMLSEEGWSSFDTKAEFRKQARAVLSYIAALAMKEGA